MRLLAFFLFMSLFCCKQKDTSDINDTLEEGQDAIVEADTVDITDSIIIPNSLEKELVFDFDDDDRLDSLFLGADVEVDANGNPMWDDGQRWFINLKMLDTLVTVYSKNIQLGKISVYFDEAKRAIYLIEEGPHNSDRYLLNKANDFVPTKVTRIPDTAHMVSVSLD